ncbi:protein disulfide-isomerase A5-like [Huso huso]|uniref:Protein disulfide-isomerase A5-like n=1 Tax=Huso huso TaxID=61971 RepID=A0ABR0ZKG8_HUSHU
MKSRHGLVCNYISKNATRFIGPAVFCACVPRRGSSIMAPWNLGESGTGAAAMLIFVLLTGLPAFLQALKMSPLIETVSDHKDFKKLLRTRTNVLILYSKSAAAGERQLKLLSDVAQAVKGQGTIAWVDCGDSEGRKLCKKSKVDPSSKRSGVELLHYKDGTFHTEYNRPETYKSMVAFLKDPAGSPLWEENPEAKDIAHVENEKEFRKLLKKEERPILMMFYAPWCGVCKRMMPAFQQAASELRGSYVLAGMNAHPSEFDGIKQEFNVKGYPTFCYFEKGKFLHHYESYGATAKDIVEWMKNPKPQEVVWSEQGSAVFHLTDDNFHQFLQDHPSVLLMFYAPWCGHCKKMKPEYDEAAEILNKNQDSPGVLAAVDSTIHKAVGERYHITGFPTVKYFENGEEKYTLPHLRSKDKIIEWLHNPQAPPPPEQSWEEKPSSVSHLGSQDFRESLKKKKHALVMFYAPWCPHCKNAVPHFTAAADLFKEDRKIAYAAVDCTKGQNNELCKQESVEGYPTFNYYNYGKFIEKYSGDRGESGFIGFMKTLRGKDQEKVGKRKEEL